MNLYLCIFLIISFTLTDFFLNLSKAAITTSNISRIKQLEEDGIKAASILAKLRSGQKPVFLATSYTLRSLCLFCISLLSFDVLYPRMKSLFEMWNIPKGSYVTWGALICTSVLVLSFVIINGRIIPRKIGIHRCETIAYSAAGVMRSLIAIFYPYTIVVLSISNFIVKLFGVPAHADEKLATEDEILMMVDASGEKGVIEESEADMLANIFEFGDTTASEAMTHRTDVEALEYTSTVRQAVDFALQNGFSRIPVYKDDLDNIQGVLYVKDLLRFVGSAENCDMPIYKLMRPACYIPESKKLSELFGEMTETKVQMAVVVDEYGGTSGIITMSIYEVSDLLDVALPEGDYDTLAGYIVSTLGRIPTEKEHPSVTYENVEFTVEQVTDRRISKVRVVKNSPSDVAESSVLQDSGSSDREINE